MASTNMPVIYNDSRNDSGLMPLPETTPNGNVTDVVHVLGTAELINHVLELYFLPVICLIGIVGNTISTIVFLQKSLRNSSCSIFLATRGISDNGFLSTLLLIWISSTCDLQLSQIRGICQMLVFLTYVCGCISVWLVVFVTAENYIRICHPFVVNRICKTRTAKIIVVILCLIVLGVYNFPFWTTNADCSPVIHHYGTIQAMVYIDTLLTLVLPTVCITVLLFVIVINVIKAYNRRGRLSAPTVKHVRNPMAKVTKMLIAVSVTFFCLNLPSHVCRLRLMIAYFLNASTTQSDAMIQKITLYIYYLSLSINFILYFTFGSKFRKVFRTTFGINKLGSRDNTQQSSALDRDDKRTPSPSILPKQTIIHDRDVSESAPLNGQYNL